MTIGTFDCEVTLLAPAAPTQSASGEVAPAPYQDMGTAWAGRRFGAGSEGVEAGEVVARQVVTWTLRYDARLQPDWRLAYAGRTYHVTAVTDIGRRVGLTLTTYCMDNDGA